MEQILFPYEQPRKIQKALIAQIQSCVENKQNLIAHAPTGLGKTISVISPILPYILKHNLTLFFLTPKHSQHHIVVETIKEIKEKFKQDIQIVDFIGKKHMCLQSGVELLPNGEFHEYCKDLRNKDICEYYLNIKNKTRREVALDEMQEPLHVEEMSKICRNHNLCPYEIAGIKGRKASIIIADFYHILSSTVRDSLFKRIQKELSTSIIYFDEAHNLPNRCRDLLTTNLSSLTIEKALKENKTFQFDYEEDLQKIKTNFQDLAKTIPLEKQEVLIKKHDFLCDISLIEPMREAAEIVREKQKRSAFGSIAHFLEAWPGPDYAYIRIIQRSFTKYGKPFTNISYRCLDPSLIMSQIQAHSLILMSGTLSPISMYLDVLGLNKEKTVTAEYSNPFPPTNRLNIIAPTTTTKFTERNDSMYKRIAKICADTINVIPGNSAIFFPSYDIQNRVYYYFQHESKKTTIRESPGLSKQERQELINTFKSYKDTGAVLLGAASGSFGEGIDLPGDFLKAVIIVGLPLAKPDLETQELINYYDERYAKGWDYGYIYPAITKALQNAGRCIRSETDKGCIVFLDERYVWESYKKCFPQDSNFVITKLPQEKVKEFFSNHEKEKQASIDKEKQLSQDHTIIDFKEK